MDAYLETDDARDLASTLIGMTQLLALDDVTLGATLLVASLDIDTAMRYQGRKFDISNGAQSLEFPRVAYGNPTTVNQFGLVTGLPMPLTADTVVWDWDAENLVAVVPPNVKRACLFQAAWLVNPANSERVAAILGGLAAQSTEGASETYRSAAELAAMAGGGTLDPRAANIMDKNYRLRSGRIL